MISAAVAGIATTSFGRYLDASLLGPARRAVEFVPELPRDHAGRAQPKLLREQATARMPQ